MNDDSNVTNGNGAAAGEESPGLVFRIGEQYIRDLSFENPFGPGAAAALKDNPNVSIEVRTDTEPLENDLYQVTLALRAEATAEERTVFIVELLYGGLFHASSPTGEDIRPLLMIEAPRHLFPFARSIIANVVRDGGFLPLMIDPIDFAALYFRQEAERKAASNGAE